MPDQIGEVDARQRDAGGHDVEPGAVALPLPVIPNLDVAEVETAADQLEVEGGQGDGEPGDALDVEQGEGTVAEVIVDRGAQRPFKDTIEQAKGSQHEKQHPDPGEGPPFPGHGVPASGQGPRATGTTGGGPSGGIPRRIFTCRTATMDET